MCKSQNVQIHKIFIIHLISDKTEQMQVVKPIPQATDRNSLHDNHQVKRPNKYELDRLKMYH